MDNIPEDMDIPQMRRDTSNEANVRWLLRNLAVRNGKHPDCQKVLDALKKSLTKP